jgi:hypothetical protein
MQKVREILARSSIRAFIKLSLADLKLPACLSGLGEEIGGLHENLDTQDKATYQRVLVELPLT